MQAPAPDNTSNKGDRMAYMKMVGLVILAGPKGVSPTVVTKGE
jgi:hypothetical protein